MNCDLCPHQPACDAREDYLIAMQYRRCAAAGEHSWLPDEELDFMEEDDMGGASQPDKKPRGKAPRICASCKQKKPIIGRGLCGNCYQKHKKAGTLPELKPRKAVAQRIEAMLACPEPSETPATAMVDSLSPITTGKSLMMPDPQDIRGAFRPDLDPGEPPAGNGDSEILLPFSVSESDQALLENIRTSAALHRRTPDQEVLWIVQCAMMERDKVMEAMEVSWVGDPERLNRRSE